MRRASATGQLPNIVWILVDSIRAYSTAGDIRGKLPVMESFAQESVEFGNCITTAPSTIMSVTAMLTGLPAYFLARNYDQFRFDNRRFPSVATILKTYGYQPFGFLRGRETRLKLGPLIEPLPRQYWPADVGHGVKWSNADLNRALDLWLEAETQRPVLLFFHYNPQTRNERKELLVDEAVSERVAQALERLRGAGFTPANTVTILCSDHGFPDPRKGLTSEWEARHRLSHDLILTDDNIRIPLYIQYPGCRPRRIETSVSALDLYPTLLELVGAVDPGGAEERREGISLVSLMENSAGCAEVFQNRVFRCDARLMFQTGRATAIRGNRYKYIRFHDEYRLPVAGAAAAGAEVLIDLQQDSKEEQDLLANEGRPPEVMEALARFRAAMDATERQALQYQLEFLLSKQGRLLATTRRQGAKRVMLVFEPGMTSLENIGLRAVSEALAGVTTDVVRARAFDGRSLLDVSFTTHIVAPGTTTTAANETMSSPRYDLSIVFVQDPAGPLARALVRESRRWKARRRLVVDCNFNAYRREKYWVYRLRSVGQLVPLILEEPTLLLDSLRTAGRVLVRDVARKLGIWDRWSAAVSEAEDVNAQRDLESDATHMESDGV